MPIKAKSPYGKNSLRPNPQTADPNRPTPLQYLQESILVGHFGDWGASARVVNGLPTAGATKPGGLGLYSSPY